VAKLVEFETRDNAASLRSNQPIQIENYEIPVRLLKSDVAQRISPKIRDSLIFTQNGEQYLRWVINPEDTQWYKDVEKFLTQNGVPATRHHYFTGYQTASRSYIVEAPNGAEFSVKVSTNHTGGNWTDKKETWDDTQQVRMAADFVDGQIRENPLKTAVTLDEPAGFGIESIDQGMLIRDLGELTEGHHYFLPGFSAMHQQTGTELARLNGSNAPARFWNDAYNRPLGRALAEFSARTGLTFDSPHSQNFLIELDSNMKPTGRIVIRDFGDTYALKEWFVAKGLTKFLANWDADNVLAGDMDVAIGILHGNRFPDWMNDAEYKHWGNDFFAAFESEYSKDTGVPRSELQQPMVQNGLYFAKDYSDKGPGWKTFFKRLAGRLGSICDFALARKNPGTTP